MLPQPSTAACQEHDGASDQTADGGSQKTPSRAAIAGLDKAPVVIVDLVPYNGESDEIENASNRRGQEGEQRNKTGQEAADEARAESKHECNKVEPGSDWVKDKRLGEGAGR